MILLGCNEVEDYFDDSMELGGGYAGAAGRRVVVSLCCGCALNQGPDVTDDKQGSTPHLLDNFSVCQPSSPLSGVAAQSIQNPTSEKMDRTAKNLRIQRWQQKRPELARFGFDSHAS